MSENVVCEHELWPVRWFDNDVNDLGVPGFKDPETRIRVITTRGTWPQ